ncbi:hypothetical protein ACHAWO_007256 [Cyclotella atomus]|uniref:Rubisco LSMT substrate-binding domain-containing protein n=1 Tax=Cyclotella atomus TaxID=382360 RepID=A0ABD3PE32_9STRA
MSMAVLFLVLYTSCLQLLVHSFTPHHGPQIKPKTRICRPNAALAANSDRLQTFADAANKALTSHGSEIFKSLNAKVSVTDKRLGLTCTSSTKESDAILSYPYYESDGSGLALSSPLATNVVFKDLLPDGYDGWTGDIGLAALLLLNEFARLDTSGGKGINLPKRKEGIQFLMGAWVTSLPSFEEMKEMHPLLWEEEDQEVMQSSSTKKIYRLLDDIEDDASWLSEKLWSSDRVKFPESVVLRVGDAEETRPCYSQDGFRYAVALVRSRSFFVDGALRLLPYLDYANHDDFGTLEISGGGVGGGIGMVWESAKGALLKAGKELKAGDEVKISYGPKGPADYLLDHGFVPEMCQSTSNTGGAVTAELTFEVDDSDRFRDDKLDVLEYETFELAPMEPVQAFDVTGGPGSTGEPDPAMMQFLRLVKLGGKDAFLLESIFRNEIWGFMSVPVSEQNERLAVTAIIDACQKALTEMDEATKDVDNATLSDKQKLCAMVRDSERQALERTMIYMKQESEALDLKEYYQERRLKSLGLDSEWSPESDDIGWGGNRVPGGADYDW